MKGQNYKYAHDYDHHWVEQQYLPDAIKDVKYYTFGLSLIHIWWS